MDENARLVKLVMARLPLIPDARDLEVTLRQAAALIDLGWAVEDVSFYLGCTEEVSPDLDEDVALRLMAKVYRKYVPNVGEKAPY